MDGHAQNVQKFENYVRSSDFFSLLLRNKFIVIMGDSNMRAFYKEIVHFLQSDGVISDYGLRKRGEMSFENDTLLEGGCLGTMNNGKKYREVRQYQTGYHLVRFYFITRVCNDYVREVLCSTFLADEKPDYLIINSCLWDISRYGPCSLEHYEDNLEELCRALDAIIDKKTQVIWTTALPISKHVKGGFLDKFSLHFTELLPFDQLLANYVAVRVMKKFQFDVLDLNYVFRNQIQNRNDDGIHWNALAHRQISMSFVELLLESNPPLKSDLYKKFGIKFYYKQAF